MGDKKGLIGDFDAAVFPCATEQKGKNGASNISTGRGACDDLWQCSRIALILGTLAHNSPTHCCSHSSLADSPLSPLLFPCLGRLHHSLCLSHISFQKSLFSTGRHLDTCLSSLPSSKQRLLCGPLPFLSRKPRDCVPPNLAAYAWCISPQPSSTIDCAPILSSFGSLCDLSTFHPPVAQQKNIGE